MAPGGGGCGCDGWGMGADGRFGDTRAIPDARRPVCHSRPVAVAPAEGPSLCNGTGDARTEREGRRRRRPPRRGGTPEDGEGLRGLGALRGVHVVVRERVRLDPVDGGPRPMMAHDAPDAGHTKDGGGGGRGPGVDGLQVRRGQVLAIGPRGGPTVDPRAQRRVCVPPVPSSPVLADHFSLTRDGCCENSDAV